MAAEYVGALLGAFAVERSSLRNGPLFGTTQPVTDRSHMKNDGPQNSRDKHTEMFKTPHQGIAAQIIGRFNVAPSELATYLGTSLVSVVRWARGDTNPGTPMQAKLTDALRKLERGEALNIDRASTTHIFASRGARTNSELLPLFRRTVTVQRTTDPKSPIASRLRRGDLWADSNDALFGILADRCELAPTVANPVAEGVSAGKNTYTYDAHTYHTKVPPQGIAEVIRRYLPKGGIVLDPFAGSGMTGVAARTLGNDVILNELSPAASFIADRFTRRCDPAAFAAAVGAVCDHLHDLRRDLYTTRCRTCGRDTEILFTVWSYRVRCSECDHEFVLWDHCRQYGQTVREHRILGKFPCPCCSKELVKSRLKRTSAEPVILGYKCCSRQQVEHPLEAEDRARIARLAATPPLAQGFFPTTELPDGVNLRQPKKHGLISIDRFYTPRNLVAMSHLWRELHRIEDDNLAGFLAFVFTSLYQRVTKLSEFRFWGGSGNTANFNVPYIFNEANVFVTFERKARTIQDHLETTASAYSGRSVVRTGSATDLRFLPDNSIDLVFTDPPFGGNINYSEMNLLWESWLGTFTDTTHEAIVNRFQGKGIPAYGELMLGSLNECHRVLRPGHWLLLVFMNSSQEVWHALRKAVLDSGFSLERVDIFDKQHGTFKQFVSDNTAGCDLLLHCRKAEGRAVAEAGLALTSMAETVKRFLAEREAPVPKLPYLHVRREEEIDYRMLYSEFLADQLIMQGDLVDFASFRTLAASFFDLA
jgi:DNA modification methylase/DNA-binding transcriptional regulator YiaG